MKSAGLKTEAPRSAAVTAVVVGTKARTEEPLHRGALAVAIQQQHELSKTNWRVASVVMLAGLVAALFASAVGAAPLAVAITASTTTVATLFFRNHRFPERQGQYYHLELADREAGSGGLPASPAALRAQAYFQKATLQSRRRMKS